MAVPVPGDMGSRDYSSLYGEGRRDGTRGGGRAGGIYGLLLRKTHKHADYVLMADALEKFGSYRLEPET